MRRPAYIEICEIVSIDYVQMIAKVKTTEGRELELPIIYSGVISDIKNYNNLRALVLYVDYAAENGVVFIAPSGIFNASLAEENAKKPKFVAL
jgi:hypothetical protein